MVALISANPARRPLRAADFHHASAAVAQTFEGVAARAGAFLGNDQRALETARMFILVDTEIGRELMRQTHTLGMYTRSRPRTPHIQAAIVILSAHRRYQVLLDQLRQSGAPASLDRQKITAPPLQLGAESSEQPRPNRKPHLLPHQRRHFCHCARNAELFS